MGWIPWSALMIRNVTKHILKLLRKSKICTLISKISDYLLKKHTENRTLDLYD